MSQVEVAEQEIGLEGQKVDSGFDDISSRVAEGDVELGRMVVAGTDLDRQGKKPAVAGDITDLNKLRGVSVRTQAMESKDFPSGSGNPRYADKENMSLMKNGRIWVKPETAVTPDDDVYVVHTGGDEGKFRNDADGGNADQIPKANAHWVTTSLADELAQLEIHL